MNIAIGNRDFRATPLSGFSDESICYKEYRATPLLIVQPGGLAYLTTFPCQRYWLPALLESLHRWRDAKTCGWKPFLCSRAPFPKAGHILKQILTGIYNSTSMVIETGATMISSATSSPKPFSSISPFCATILKVPSGNGTMASVLLPLK